MKIIKYLKDNPARGVGLVLALLALALGIWGYTDQHSSFKISDFLRDFYANISTELASIAVTVLFIDALNQRRAQQQEEIQQNKARLKKLMRSPSQAITAGAIEELEKHGWLYDGWLDGAYLSYSNLQNVRLHKANLQGVRLKSAKAQGADFSYADLQGAGLSQARLQGANFRHSDLEGASLKEAMFDETTILPDGANWTPETDMARFTDRDHPEFWRSGDSNSPAFQEEPATSVSTSPLDDLTRIEGIGPKIAAILKDAGIDTFAKLADSSVDTLKDVLRSAGVPYAPSLPNWSEQATYAARGDWDGLKSFQDKLIGGRRQ